MICWFFSEVWPSIFFLWIRCLSIGSYLHQLLWSPSHNISGLGHVCTFIFALYADILVINHFLNFLGSINCLVGLPIQWEKWWGTRPWYVQITPFRLLSRMLISFLFSLSTHLNLVVDFLIANSWLNVGKEAFSLWDDGFCYYYLQW